MKTQRGFTIIELMIAIMVLGILATVAAPSFSEILKQNRLATQVNTLLASINFARSETINQNTNVVLTPITAGTNDWADGWEVRLNSATGPVLRNFEGVKNTNLVSSVATITYRADGSIQGAANITLDLTPSDCPTGKDHMRRITIRLSGQSGSSHLNCP